MKVAITADLHLTTRAEHPERYGALEDILSQVQREEIETLILAGDVFDKTLRDYAEFEALCADSENQGITFAIIPGNHDPGISGAAITPSNVRVFTEPELVGLGPGAAKFLLIPYVDSKTMGECVVPLADRLGRGDWVLIGHGDWAGNLRGANPYEPGVYMPLTNRDIEVFRPARVFLGHIHAACDQSPVHYPGSPYGLDISETGRRRFLVYDTESGEVEARPVDTDVLYFSERFVIVPMEDEPCYIDRVIRARIASWRVTEPERPKVRVRVKVSGYSSDRAALKDAVAAAFSGFRFYKDEEPDISEVLVSDDMERQHIADQVKASIEELAWQGDDEPDKDQILLDALRVIYGG